jgi:hypothetical protein
MIPVEQPKSVAVEVSDRDRLHPWLIVRELPNFQRVTVARLRRRNQAETLLKVLQRLNPDRRYLIIFEPPELPESFTSAVNLPVAEPQKAERSPHSPV